MLAAHTFRDTLRDTLAFLERVTRAFRHADDPTLKEWGVQASRHVEALRSVAEPCAPRADLEAPSPHPATPRPRIRTALSVREEQVLRLIASGHSNKEVATALGLSVKTIESHKANAVHRLDLQSRADIVRHALAAGWLRVLPASPLAPASGTPSGRAVPSMR